MFRIKTDIRQFNCETQDKVEKLIRSWVIRPTDLIYLSGPKEWSPIGDHPEFEALFVSLRDLGDQSSIQETSEQHISDVSESSDASLSGSSETSDNVNGSAASASILSGRGKFKTSSAPASTKEESGPLPVPQAPEGVEPQANDGEVTMMTDRTADFLGLDEEDERETSEQDKVSPSSDQPLPMPQAPEGVEPAVQSEEQTAVFKKSLHEESSTPEQSDDPDASASAEFVLEEIQMPEGESHTEVEAVPRLGRHDLPEELFLTNELSSPVEKQSLLDELGQVEESDASEGIDDHPLKEESDEDPDDSMLNINIDEQWSDVTGDLDDVISSVEGSEASEVSEAISKVSEVSEVSEAAESSVASEASEADDEPTESLRETIELEPFEIQRNSEVSGAEDDESEEGEVPIPKGLVSAVELSEPSDSSEIDEPEEIESFFEDSSPVLDENGEIFQDPNFVSEGYAMELPIQVGFQQEDAPFGLRASPLSDSDKDALFPRPAPKTRGEVVEREFALIKGSTRPVNAPAKQNVSSSSTDSSPQDHSFLLVAILLISLVLIILTLIVGID